MTSPENVLGRAVAASLLLAASLSWTGGCAAPEPAGFRLEDAVAAGGDVGLTLAAGARVADVEVGDERRRAVVTAVEPWQWQGRLPAGAQLSLGLQVLPRDRSGVETVEVQVEVTAGRHREIVEVGRTREERWLDLLVDMAPWSGRRVMVEVRPRVVAASPSGAQRHLAWSHAALSGRRAAGEGPPNVLLIVVDTLRADRLTPYGYERATSPEIQRLLADRGVVVEEAYAQAPWTVPSVVSYMTGRYPGELLSGPMEGYAIPPGVETVAERMAAQGYETGAFYGNFILRDANGFGRGFATRYTPPATPESNQLHADSVNARAIPWLEAHQQRPFFLYVHYMDPHDPYANPGIIDGRSPFFPDYRGELSGLSVHGVYIGRIPLQDPEEDVAHLSALYDSEVHYVDAHIGELLAHLEEEVAARTLIVLTSDHGEELYDHGGWKHGQTLYQEQIRVPLILRWDGRIEAGSRLPGTVQLVDLLPTLIAAVGGDADPAWQGVDLLPALADGAPLPRRPAFAENLASGPLRAAAVLGSSKLIFFNREEPLTPANQLIEHLWRQDLGRMDRRELYDLATDPKERRNLVGEEPQRAAALEPVIHHRLDAGLPGLRILASGLPAGASLSGRITFERPPAVWHPYFTSPQDLLELAGTEVRFELVGEPPEAGPGEKGLWLEGELGSILGIEAWLDNFPLAAAGILLGPGTPYQGGEVTPPELAAPHRPRAPDGPALRLWTRQGIASAGAEVDAEVERSLRALGYIQ